MALQLVHITDKGATRPSNQDSFCARISNFGRETIAMLAVCDGVGGLQSGELASTGAVRCFEEWFERQLPEIVQSGLTADVVFFSWHRMLETLHTALCSYSGKTGIQLGTTVSALLLTRDALYQVQVGDSRIYLDDGLGLVQLSKDQTLAMQAFARSIDYRPTQQYPAAVSWLWQNGAGFSMHKASGAGRSAAVQRRIVPLHNAERAAWTADGNGQPRAATAAAAGGGGILPQLRRDGQHHSTGTEMERPELSDVWYG